MERIRGNKKVEINILVVFNIPYISKFRPNTSSALSFYVNVNVIFVSEILVLPNTVYSRKSFHLI